MYICISISTCEQCIYIYLLVNSVYIYIEELGQISGHEPPGLLPLQCVYIPANREGERGREITNRANPWVVSKA